MNGERVIHTGGTPPPITLNVTCSRCYRIYRYDCPLTAVVVQVLADEGWRFPGVQQICPQCLSEDQAQKQVDEGAIGGL